MGAAMYAAAEAEGAAAPTDGATGGDQSDDIVDAESVDEPADETAAGSEGTEGEPK